MGRANIAISILYLFLFGLLLAAAPVESQQQQYGHVYKRPSHGHGLFPWQPNPAPQPKINTIADDAENFWESNKCVYPPEDFYMTFRAACDVSYDAKSFYAGICRSFFNVSKPLCRLNGATEDEIQTMKSITDIQTRMENDEICDTLSMLKESDHSLFPQPTGDNKWFEPSYNLIFSTATCQSVCGLPKAHPICFGFLLNYNYIEDSRSRKIDDADLSDDVTDDPAEGDAAKSTSNNVEEEENIPPLGNQTDMDQQEQSPSIVDMLIPDLFNLSDTFRPNPKLLNTKPSDTDYYYPIHVADLETDSDTSDDNVVLSEALEKNPELLKNILEIGEVFMPEESEETENDDAYRVVGDLEIAEVVELPNDMIVEIQSNLEGDNSELQQQLLAEDLESLTRIDTKQELPMLSILLLFSSAIAVLSLCVLYKARKKIGLYVRHMRQRRRNNWNYERVLTVQPDDDEYYE